MNFVSTIIVDKKNNKKWLLIGLTIILLGIIVVIVSFKIVNKKPIDDIQKPINYQEQLKEMLEKSTNQSKYKLNIEFDIENNTEKIAYGTYEIMIDHETYIANIDSKVYKNEDIAWVSQYDLRKNVYLNQDQSLQMQEEANPEYIYTLLGNANDVTNTTAIISKDDMTKALKTTNLRYLADISSSAGINALEDVTVPYEYDSECMLLNKIKLSILVNDNKKINITYTLVYNA
ncbi:MAG: hypothetical protein SOZ04_05455 [Bacilli bacterium]|nr:hypothetical protein [Bacilli bacterium]